MITFEIDKLQENKIRFWSKEVEERYMKKTGLAREEINYGAAGGSLTYKFIPTGLGVITIVVHALGEELDLTDYDSW